MDFLRLHVTQGQGADRVGEVLDTRIPVSEESALLIVSTAQARGLCLLPPGRRVSASSLDTWSCPTCLPKQAQCHV